MDIKLIAVVIVVLALVGAAVVVNVVAPGEAQVSVEPQKMVIKAPATRPWNVAMFTVDGKAYLLYGIQGSVSYLYIVPVPQSGNIDLSKAKPVLTVQSKVISFSYAQYLNHIYVGMCVNENRSYIADFVVSSSGISLSGNTTLPMGLVHVELVNGKMFVVAYTSYYNTELLQFSMSGEYSVLYTYPKGYWPSTSYVQVFGDKIFLNTRLYNLNTSGSVLNVVVLAPNQPPKVIINEQLSRSCYVSAIPVGSEDYLYVVQTTGEDTYYTDLYKINTNTSNYEKYKMENDGVAITYQSGLFIGGVTTLTISKDGMHFANVATIYSRNDIENSYCSPVSVGTHPMAMNGNVLYMVDNEAGAHGCTSQFVVLKYDLNGVTSFFNI